MNIALFTDTYYPEINGVANSVYILKQELERQEHNVYVFTTTTPGAPKNEHNVFRVPSLPCILITERRVGLFYQHKLAAIIKKLDLDIIHTNTEFSLGIFGRIMAKEYKIPIVHTYHTIYEDYTHYITHRKALDNRAKAFMRVFSKVCCNTVEQVIVPTDKTKELLMQYSVHKNINVVPTGINLEKFDPDQYKADEILELRRTYGIKEKDKVLLYLGRLSPEKGISFIIKTMSRYMKQHQEVKLLIVGEGPERGHLEELANELNFGEQVIFTGGKPWDEIGKYYCMGDVFVSASTSETQGLTYIEAMAAGLPIVVKEDRCLEDILVSGYNGYSFTSEEEFMRGLDQVLYEAEINFSWNARKIVEKYSSTAFAEHIIKVYESIMELDRIAYIRLLEECKPISYIKVIRSGLF